MKPHRRIARLVPALVLLAVPAGLNGQDLTDRWTIELPSNLAVVTTVGGVSPGSNTGSVSAFGAAWGQGFIGAGYQERARYRDEDDGTAVVGIGLGDPRRYVGIEVAVTSSNTLEQTPFQDGFLSFKVHRSLPSGFGIAVGVENIVDWDGDDNPDSGPDADESWYGVVSKVWGLDGTTPFKTVTASLGVGSGRFQSEEDFLADEDGIGVFGALATQIVDQVSLIADWNGQDLGIGASIAPFQSFPLVVTPAVMDVTENAGDGARFVVGVGIGFEWANWFRN